MSKFIRFDDLEPTYLTAEQMEPFVVKAMEKYYRQLLPKYGDDLLTPEVATIEAMSKHHIALINNQYLVGYIIGREWYSTVPILQEEFLIRINRGDARLSDVMQVLCLLKKFHKVRHCQIGTRASGNQEAIERLYGKYGVEKLMMIMRF